MKKRSAKSRRMFFESLENRRVLAANVLHHHNFEIPEDTDGNGLVAPVDALMVINALNVRDASSQSNSTNRLLDVNADRKVSPIDALLIINVLNQSKMEVSVASQVSTERRIARIDQAIQDDALPFSFSKDRAEEILATLRAGGRPELGDHMIGDDLYQNDKLSSVDEKLDRLSSQLSQLGVAESRVAGIIDDLRLTTEEGETDLRKHIRDALESADIDFASLLQRSSAERMLDGLADKLRALDVDATKVETAISNIRQAIEAGESNLRSVIQSELAKAGIDLKAILEGIEESRFYTKFEERLEELGVAPAVIENLVAEVKEAILNGETNIRELIKTKLAEAQIDIRQLLEDYRNEQLLENLAERLTEAGVDSSVVVSIITNVRNGLEDDNANFGYLVKSALEEAGVDLAALINDDKRDRMLDRLESHLTKLGIDQDDIDTFMDTIKSAIESGDPLTPEEIAASLRELGIDPKLVFPDHRSDLGDREVDLDRVVRGLKFFGVSDITISEVESEAAAWIDQGKKLTVSKLIDILVDTEAIPSNTMKRIRELLGKR